MYERSVVSRKAATQIGTKNVEKAFARAPFESKSACKRSYWSRMSDQRDEERVTLLRTTRLGDIKVLCLLMKSFGINVGSYWSKWEKHVVERMIVGCGLSGAIERVNWM
ncbi:hypothetical protein JTB14_036416 [Gonioctena quinquepunctata]|nr:hypothetical protein JTB14_036416 [Gonioctena quinquepunctata]